MMTGALLILGLSVVLLLFYVIEAARRIWRIHGEFKKNRASR
jgi:hypothetical protein